MLVCPPPTSLSLEPQTDTLSAAGCKKLFTDVASGVRTERPGLDSAIAFCRKGDTLMLWKLDRMGRSMSHLIEMVQKLEAKGVGFKSLAENIDNTTAGGRFFFHVFGALAEFERVPDPGAVQAGLKSVRARGRKGGRPPVPDETKAMAKILLADKSLKENGSPPPEFEFDEDHSYFLVRQPVQPDARRAAEEATAPSRPESGVESGVESEMATSILNVLQNGAFWKKELAQHLGKVQPTRYLNDLLCKLVTAKLIEYTIPDKPTSRLQKYRLTEKSVEPGWPGR